MQQGVTSEEIWCAAVDSVPAVGISQIPAHLAPSMSCLGLAVGHAGVQVSMTELADYDTLDMTMQD